MDLLEVLRHLDTDIFRELNKAGISAPIDALMVGFTLIGISYIIILVAIPLWLGGKREASIYALVLVAVVTLVTEVMKVVVDRQRPSAELSGVHTILSASGPSFPSAHASRAFAVALLVWRNTNHRWGAAGIAIASLIALSRVYLGVHWPSDVAAGTLLGLLLARLMEYATKRSPRYRKWQERVIVLVERATERRHGSSRFASERAVMA
jgi:membrane-associated phospholipid phosphatase